MITIDTTFNGKKILAKKGDVIKVQLAENPTTGYLWKIKSSDDKHLKIKKEEYEISGEAIGAGGIRSLHLEVISKGISELLIALGNPWENDSVETFRITIES